MRTYEYAKISPDSDYWGEGTFDDHARYYSAVMHALERIGYQEGWVENESTDQETTVLLHDSHKSGDELDPYEELDWFSVWCGMRDGHDDVEAIVQALTGMLRRMDTERFYVDDTGAATEETP